MRSRVMLWMLGAGACVLGAGMLAAPVRGGEVPYLTREELEKLPMVSVADPKAIENALVFPEVRTGIYLPRETVAAGDSVKAWLVVKSLARDPQRGIPADFELGGAGEKPRVEGTARLQLVQLKDGGEGVVCDMKGKLGRSTPRVLLPAEGFFVNCGDVRNLSASALQPGQYRLRFWAEGQRSEATFRIVPAAARDATVLPAARGAFADLASHDAAVLNWIGAFQGRPQAKGGYMHWPLRNGYMAPRSVEDFRLGIAMGMGNGPAARYYPRLQDIPSQDEVVSITAKFADGSSNKLQITLRPVALGAGAATGPAAASAPATGPAGSTTKAGGTAVDPVEVQLPAYPAIYLLIESLERPAGSRISSERQGGPNSLSNRFNVPYVMEAQLPQEWTSRLNFTGKARLTVIFASEPIRGGAEQEGEGYQQQIPRQFNRGNRVVGRRWTGVVRAAPLEFVIKPPAGDGN